MLIKAAIHSILRNPRRMISIVLTIGVGSATLYIVYGFNSGLIKEYREKTIHSQHGHGKIFQKGYYNTSSDTPWNNWIENYSSLSEDLEKLPFIYKTFPRTSFYAILSNGYKTIDARGEGIVPSKEILFFTGLNFIEGGPLETENDGIVLGVGLAKVLNLKVGDNLSVLTNTIHNTSNAIDLTINGVFQTGNDLFDKMFFRISLTHSQMLLDTGKIESIAVALNENYTWKNFDSHIKDNYNNLEAISLEELEKAIFSNSINWLSSQFVIILVIIYILVILAILNSISTSIVERFKELGNLRANGDSKLDLFKTLMLENLILGITGSSIGIFVALVISNLFLKSGILMPPPPSLVLPIRVTIAFSFKMILFSLLFGIITSMLSTCAASIQVIKKPIVNLLRAE